MTTPHRFHTTYSVASDSDDSGIELQASITPNTVQHDNPHAILLNIEGSETGVTRIFLSTDEAVDLARGILASVGVYRDVQTIAERNPTSGPRVYVAVAPDGAAGIQGTTGRLMPGEPLIDAQERGEFSIHGLSSRDTNSVFYRPDTPAYPSNVGSEGAEYWCIAYTPNDPNLILDVPPS